MEPHPVLVGGEHAVQHERMQVDVEIECATETLHDDDGAAATIGNAVVLGATPEEPQHRPHEDAADRPAQVVIPR